VVLKGSVRRSSAVLLGTRRACMFRVGASAGSAEPDVQDRQVFVLAEQASCWLTAASASWGACKYMDTAPCPCSSTCKGNPEPRAVMSAGFYDIMCAVAAHYLWQQMCDYTGTCPVMTGSAPAAHARAGAQVSHA